MLLAACSSAAPAEPGPDAPYVPPAESCAPASLDDVGSFAACSTGGGVFGQWTVDDRGLPAYDYGLDENADTRARWYNTEKLDRRAHWHAFGNARVSAMFANDGWVELTTQDRGESYLDVFDEEHGNFAGGYSYVDDGERLWSTAYKWRARGERVTRRFGMGYAETTATYRDVRVARRLASPPGDAPVVVDEVTLENLSSSKKTLRHFEVWDVARRPIETNWIVSGSALTNAPGNARMKRDARNADFVEAVSWDPAARVLGLRRTGPPADKDAPDPVERFPGDPFLAVLSGDVGDLWTEQSAFFGAGGIAAPSGARAPGEGTAAGVKGQTRSGDGQPRAFVIRSDVSLAPGEKRTLRFAYGYAPMGEPFAVDPSWASRDLVVEQAADLRSHAVSFASDRDPVLHRELAWHAAQIEASVAWRAYWGRHVVPQGSAYLYLHGADGALRDLALFAVPLAYTHRALAKEELLLAAGMHRASDRQFSYAFQGHGVLDDAAGIHTNPSDLDVFFLWAVAEYVLATGDTSLLDERAPYWPKEALPTATMRDHVRDALRHLFDVVGTGAHGLVRVGTGDWSDGIVFEAPNRDVAIAKGESVPNTQMAAWVLPLAALVVEPWDAALAKEARDRSTALRASLASAWAGSFYGRAYFGDGVLRYADKPNLEAQVWALVADTFATPGDRAATVSVVAQQLDDPSPTGATLVPGGQVWPAISALLTWGYGKVDAERAWRHLARNTLSAHAVAFPNVWYGIWSGPDGMSALGAAPPSGGIDVPTAPGPGETWFSLVTPMTDFPVMNNNQHTMPILAALRTAGLEPTAGGLRLTPHAPSRALSMKTELFDLRVDGARISGTYRPVSARSLEVVLPGPVLRARVGGIETVVPPNASSVVLGIPPGGATFDVEGGT